MTIEAAPIVVDPSGDFLGVDGSWSTFLISAGSPPQQLQVLASTEVTSTWVIAPGGCDQGDASNCTDARGGAYDDTMSSTWNLKDLYGLGYESNLGYQGTEYNGTYGYDTLGIQGKGANVSVDHQVIAAIENKKFFVGNLGLSPYQINFTSSTDSSPSLLASLKNKNLIPGLSYGYTAGASYQQKNGVTGSLTLGGYDASRFVPNDLSFNFAPTEKRQLVVGLQSISYSSSKSETPLLSEGTLAVVDSTVPYLWLPQTACQAFEKAFGISQDPISNLYLVNDTLHETLLKQNASVVFQLANGPTGGPSVNITLPYASFDLEADYPLVKKRSKYFPLQRANDDSDITLGRVFFQEAFIMVDYEHQNFSISQAVFHPNAQSHIVSLASQSTTTDSPAPNPTSTTGPVIKTTTGSGSHGIGTGAIAGIAIAIVLIASLIGTFFIFKSLRRRNSKKVNKGAIEVDASDLKDMPDIDEDSKKDFPADLEVKKPVTATVTVNEAVGPMTPPSEVDGGYFFTGNETGQVQTRTVELPGSPPNRSELSTPEPWTPELPSPDPEAIRSELSTPDPCYNHAELPSPDPSQGLDSPGISSISSGQPSPPLYDNRSSALHSPTHLPLHRPTSDRIDSSESEAGFTRDGMLNRPFHRRYQSDDSLSPSLLSRPLSSRMDSSDSDAFIHPHPIDESSESEPIVSPIIRRMPLRHFDSSDSESEAPSPQPGPSRHIRGLTTPFHSSSSSRPAMVRSNPTDARQSSQHSDSSDSDEWQTRYNSASTESPSELSRFPSLRNQRGVANGGAEARDGVLVEESSEREEGDR